MIDGADQDPQDGGWTQRELCDDGSCIGVLDSEGRCRECGKLSARAVLDPRQRGLRPQSEADAELEKRRVVHATPEAPDDWNARQLCPNGACIGVIAEGRCRQCGARGDGEPPSR